jgi:hypothetical protein
LVIAEVRVEDWFVRYFPHKLLLLFFREIALLLSPKPLTARTRHISEVVSAGHVSGVNAGVARAVFYGWLEVEREEIAGLAHPYLL